MKLFGKGSKFYSVFFFKCPRCQEGDMFETGAFSWKKPFDMYSHCPNCGLNYEPEPGFYYGAMFISYIVTAWFCIFFVMFFHWIIKLGLFTSFGLLLAVLAFLFVWFFRHSRAIWLNVNVKYEGKK